MQVKQLGTSGYTRLGPSNCFTITLRNGVGQVDATSQVGKMLWVGASVTEKRHLLVDE